MEHTQRPDAGHSADSRGAERRRILRLVAVASVLAGGLGAFFAFDLHHLLSFESLAEERERLHAWVASRPILAPVAVSLVYALAVLFSLPVAAFLSVAAGFLLGTATGTIAVVSGATLGATGLFMLARSAFGERWRGKVSRVLQRFDEGFQENAFQYLLVLRLIPVIPFFLLNIAPAFAGVSARSFIASTFLGIIPGAIVYCSVGAGLGVIFAQGQVPNIETLLGREVMLPLLGLAVLAALPLVYSRWRARQRRAAKTTSPSAY